MNVNVDILSFCFCMLIQLQFDFAESKYRSRGTYSDGVSGYGWVIGVTVAVVFIIVGSIVFTILFCKYCVPKANVIVKPKEPNGVSGPSQEQSSTMQNGYYSSQQNYGGYYSSKGDYPSLFDSDYSANPGAVDMPSSLSYQQNKSE